MALKSLSSRGITRRWLLNGLSVFAIVVVLFEVAFFFAVRVYVYAEVENVLRARAGAQAVLLERNMLTESFDFEGNAGELVESFTVGTQVPKGVPLPVVNSTMWQPAAASAVEATKSLPGVDSRVTPFLRWTPP